MSPVNPRRPGSFSSINAQTMAFVQSVTGKTPEARLSFLRSVQTRATEHAPADWKPPR